MEAWVFIVILAVMALGIGAGFAIGRSTNSVQRRSEALESEITQLREQMSDYRQQVGQHFAQTADVVNAMTANYRALYDHLSKGAQDLCGEQFTSAKLDSSAMRFIEHRGDEVGTPFPAAESADAAAGAEPTGTETAASGPEAAADQPTDGPSHIADAMEKSAQADREETQGNGRADEETFKAELHESRATGQPGNGEVPLGLGPRGPAEQDREAADDQGQTAAPGQEGEDEEPKPTQVADANASSRVDSTTLH